VSRRLMRAVDISEADIANLSLGELINTLFLMHGDGGSTGNFSVSFGAALKIVGHAMMWQEPRVKPSIVDAEEPRPCNLSAGSSSPPRHGECDAKRGTRRRAYLVKPPPSP
jgi:hypothetical protein